MYEAAWELVGIKKNKQCLPLPSCSPASKPRSERPWLAAGARSMLEPEQTSHVLVSDVRLRCTCISVTPSSGPAHREPPGLVADDVFTQPSD